MSAIIKVENLSKSYIINHEGQERYTAMRDVIAKKAKKIFSFPSTLVKSINTTQYPSENKEEFWALRDLNFEINQGDRVGIIGRNGAGKSTLLKILSRITEPTKGKISIKGRVASLLEVGTGFHPELTGRENIYLNGAILGMSRAEIKKQFDAIVDFAEVERFLDTPVKRYSSGMYVRLAFAVAAHLEPEILVVDEVLAVGDAQFQKKCLGKMEDVSKNEGRTVLFVSHNMGAVKTLCNKGILLKTGQIIVNSTMTDAITQYNSVNELFGRKFSDCLSISENNLSIEKLIINNKESGKFYFSTIRNLKIEIMGNSKKILQGALDISLFNSYNDRILFFSPGHIKNEFITIDGNFTLIVDIEIPSNLNGGLYGLHLNFSYPMVETFFELKDTIEVIIEPKIAINGREFNYENSGYIILE
jgi:lipopolysaccharide transport system ATP-binding protein